MKSYHFQDEVFMRYAMAYARRGVKSGQTPFGACIVRRMRRGKIKSQRKILSPGVREAAGEYQLIVLAHNCVWEKTDITAHAEVVAIRKACQRLQTVSLKNCVMYSTCEPCPMCFSACHWAGIKKIYFGASIRDAQKAGFNELSIAAQRMKKLGQSSVHVSGGLLKKENAAILAQWGSSKRKKVY